MNWLVPSSCGVCNKTLSCNDILNALLHTSRVYAQFSGTPQRKSEILQRTQTVNFKGNYVEVKSNDSKSVNILLN